MAIWMKKETDKTVTLKEIRDMEVLTAKKSKRTGRTSISKESLFNHSNSPRGYARMLELQDFKEITIHATCQKNERSKNKIMLNIQ